MRTAVKHHLARFRGDSPARGMTALIYHRVGGGSPDERDVTPEAFTAQLNVLADHAVIDLDEAARRLRAGDESPGVVLTFDDGFADVYDNAWPLLQERHIPFTLYLATAYVGGQMSWEGSTARSDGPALTWHQIEDMVASGLCTVGNHTHNHVLPAQLTPAELDACTAAIEHQLGVTPRHFAYPWGISVPAMEAELAARFDTAVTGDLGRNLPGHHALRLRRVPVRQTDPVDFFQAKLTGRLLPERTYGALVAAAKRAGARA